MSINPRDVKEELIQIYPKKLRQKRSEQIVVTEHREDGSVPGTSRLRNRYAAAVRAPFLSVFVLLSESLLKLAMMRGLTTIVVMPFEMRNEYRLRWQGNVDFSSNTTGPRSRW